MLDTLEIVGLAILLGFIFGRLFNYFKIPSVAGYVVIGVFLGKSVFNIFHADILDNVNILSDIALSVIAIVIGGELRWIHLKRMGKQVFFIVFFEAFFAFFLVMICVQYYYQNWPLSLILGAISAATAPAATVLVIKELKSKGKLTNMLMAVVAIDDGISLIIFCFASAIAKSLIGMGNAISMISVLEVSFLEIVGAVLMGIIAGVTISIISRIAKNSDSLLIVVLGTMFMLSGLSRQFGTSMLLANMTLGIYLVNMMPLLSKKVFSSINKVAPSLFIAFFVTAGAHLRVDVLIDAWKLGLIYFFARAIGKLSGATLGATISNFDKKLRRHVGFGLLSQVGVAIGLALVVNKEFYSLGEEGKQIAVIAVNILLGTTILTEIIGPIMTKYALIKSGDAKQIK